MPPIFDTIGTEAVPATAAGPITPVREVCQMTNSRATNADASLQARRPVALSLRAVPADWHHDRPAYAGDPYMDWESSPEAPQEPRWTKRLIESGPTQH